MARSDAPPSSTIDTIEGVAKDDSGTMNHVGEDDGDDEFLSDVVREVRAAEPNDASSQENEQTSIEGIST